MVSAGGRQILLVLKHDTRIALAVIIIQKAILMSVKLTHPQDACVYSPQLQPQIECLKAA